MESCGDSVNMVPYHNLTDGLRTANDPRFLGLLEQGV